MSLRLGIFLAVVLVQLAVPLSFILKHERTLAKGETLRFRTRPVDPVDPFQGRYVIINLADRAVTISPEQERHAPIKRRSRQAGYAQITVDADGWASFSDWTTTPPADGPYLATHLSKYGRIFAEIDGEPDSYRIEIPFNRYYMPEHLAPRAERLVGRGREEFDCWVEVNLHNGHAVITGLYLDDRPIEEAVLDLE